MNLEMLEIILTLLAIWVAFALAVDVVFATIVCVVYAAFVVLLLAFLNLFNDY